MQNNTIIAQMPNEISAMVNNDVASMYPSAFDVMNKSMWGKGGIHKFQCEMDALNAYHDWQESRSRKDLMTYLNAKWVIKRHKKLYPEEYV